jgi:hypothetical protein
MIDSELFIKRSKQFVLTWRDILCRTYGWKYSNEFCMVPDFFSIKPVASCLPLLDHSHFCADSASEYIRRPDFYKARIRVLTPESSENINIGDPVVMRIVINGRSEKEVWKSLSSVCRNRIRKAKNQNYELFQGTRPKLIEDGYQIFMKIMNRHGTPAFPKRLFHEIVTSGLGEMIILYKNKIPVCMLFLILADDIAWVPWCGAVLSEKKGSPNHLTHWQAIETAIAKNLKIFDFGRSDYGGGTYIFKSKWGAKPVPVRTISMVESNPYRYFWASRIWKQLPAVVSRTIGPKLTRYLPDY